MSPRRTITIAALALALGVVAGCSSDDGEPETTNVSDPSMAEQTIAPDDTTGG